MRHLSDKELEALKKLKVSKALETVNAGANTKSAVVGNEQNNTNPRIDPRVVEAALKKVELR